MKYSQKLRDSSSGSRPYNGSETRKAENKENSDYINHTKAKSHGRFTSNIKKHIPNNFSICKSPAKIITKNNKILKSKRRTNNYVNPRKITAKNQSHIAAKLSVSKVDNSPQRLFSNDSNSTMNSKHLPPVINQQIHQRKAQLYKIPSAQEPYFEHTRQSQGFNSVGLANRQNIKKQGDYNFHSRQAHKSEKSLSKVVSNKKSYFTRRNQSNEKSPEGSQHERNQRLKTSENKFRNAPHVSSNRVVASNASNSHSQYSADKSSRQIQDFKNIVSQ